MQMNYLKSLGVIGLMAFSAIAIAHNDKKDQEYRVGQLKIENPYTRSTDHTKYPGATHGATRGCGACGCILIR